MTAKDFIEFDIPALTSSQKVGDALRYMNEEQVNQLVLLNDEQVIGILEEDFLYNFDENTELSLIPLKITEVAVSEDTHFLNLADYLIGKDLSVCAVVDFENKYLGSIKAADIYKEVIKGQFSGKGSLISLKIEAKDYSLSDISRIVESEGIKIERLYLAVENDAAYHFIIKFNKKSIQKALLSLKRFGYEVEAISGFDNEKSFDKDRFGLLMKYLEI